MEIDQLFLKQNDAQKNEKGKKITVPNCQVYLRASEKKKIKLL